MNKADLIHKLNSLGGITNDERAYLINLVNTKKKYGLVWEEKPEDVEELLRENLPILREVAEKRILSKDLPTPEKKDETLFDGEETDELPTPPNHILIEGDNLHALTALTFTHEGKVDVIYIDPPYNTGNKDFKYNDSFVDREDSYRHSKWLSFMHKRLLIAKDLLRETGVVFISIDDNEQAQLKLLCDEIFGENNFLADVIWEKADSPRMDANFFSSRHDHTLVYGKNISSLVLGKINTSDESVPVHYSKIDKSGRAFYLKPLRAMGKDGKREARPTMYYGVTAPDGTIVFPKNPDGTDSRWRWSKDKLENEIDRTEWLNTKSGWSLYFRIYADENESKPPETIWFNKDVGSNRTSKLELTSICPNSPFDTPKPLGLIKRILNLTSVNVDFPIILDFFAGSGTTLHATMNLNAEDGGYRQCILVTNNENNIAEEVCYERNKRIIQGYTNAKGQWIQGLTKNNLRYYKSDFVPREQSLKNKRQLTKSATDLLTIKENCYTDCTDEFLSGNQSWIKLFSDDLSQFLCIIYDDGKIEEAVIVLKQLIVDRQPEKSVKVYVFSNGQYPFTEEFEEVLQHITLCALPDAIYKAYQNVLPSKKSPRILEFEDISDESASQTANVFVDNDLFNQEG